MWKEVEFHVGFRFFLIIATPFAFVINPYFLLAIIVCQMFSYFKCGESADEKFFLMFLCATSFTGVSVFGIKIYDILIFSYFLYVLVKSRGNIYMMPAQILYMSAVLIVYFIHFELNTFVEVLRYIFSIMLMVLILNSDMDPGKYKSELIEIVVANLYYAVSIFVMILRGWGHNFTGKVLSTDIYIFSTEMRMNGFFTDPNKYMTFCFTLLIFVKLFWKEDWKKRCIITLLLLSALVSGARTTVIIVVLYFVLAFFRFCWENDRILFVIGVCAALLSGMFIIVFSGGFIDAANRVFVSLTRLLGRTNTLRINADIMNDNRIYVWRLAVGIIEEQLFLGHGWLSYTYLLPFATHNTFISLLLDGGIFMATAYALFYRRLIFNKYWNITLPMFLIPILVLDLSNYRMHYLLLALIEFYLREEEEDMNRVSFK